MQPPSSVCRRFTATSPLEALPLASPASGCRSAAHLTRAGVDTGSPNPVSPNSPHSARPPSLSSSTIRRSRRTLVKPAANRDDPMDPGFGVRAQLMTIRVLLADDHVVVRRLLRGLIEDGSGCAVCGEAADGAEAGRLAQDLNPDVVVLDISMPEMDGLEPAKRIRVRSAATPVLTLTIADTEQSVRVDP